MYEIITYVTLHLSMLHIVFNFVSLLPAMSQFEKKQGTLACILVTVIPYTLFPGIMHLIVYHFFLRKDYVSIAGLSGWAFAFISASCVHSPQRL